MTLLPPPARSYLTELKAHAWLFRQMPPKRSSQGAGGSANAYRKGGGPTSKQPPIPTSLVSTASPRGGPASSGLSGGGGTLTTHKPMKPQLLRVSVVDLLEHPIAALPAAIRAFVNRAPAFDAVDAAACIEQLPLAIQRAKECGSLLVTTPAVRGKAVLAWSHCIKLLSVACEVLGPAAINVESDHDRANVIASLRASTLEAPTAADAVGAAAGNAGTLVDDLKLITEQLLGAYVPLPVAGAAGTRAPLLASATVTVQLHNIFVSSALPFPPVDASGGVDSLPPHESMAGGSPHSDGSTSVLSRDDCEDMGCFWLGVLDWLVAADPAVKDCLGKALMPCLASAMMRLAALSRAATDGGDDDAQGGAAAAAEPVITNFRVARGVATLLVNLVKCSKANKASLPSWEFLASTLAQTTDYFLQLQALELSYRVARQNKPLLQRCRFAANVPDAVVQQIAALPNDASLLEEMKRLLNAWNSARGPSSQLLAFDVLRCEAGPRPSGPQDPRLAVGSEGGAIAPVGEPTLICEASQVYFGPRFFVLLLPGTGAENITVDYDRIRSVKLAKATGRVSFRLSDVPFHLEAFVDVADDRRDFVAMQLALPILEQFKSSPVHSWILAVLQARKDARLGRASRSAVAPPRDGAGSSNSSEEVSAGRTSRCLLQDAASPVSPPTATAAVAAVRMPPPLPVVAAWPASRSGPSSGAVVTSMPPPPAPVTAASRKQPRATPDDGHASRPPPASRLDAATLPPPAAAASKRMMTSLSLADPTVGLSPVSIRQQHPDVNGQSSSHVPPHAPRSQFSVPSVSGPAIQDEEDIDVSSVVEKLKEAARHRIEGRRRSLAAAVAQVRVRSSTRSQMRRGEVGDLRAALAKRASEIDSDAAHNHDSLLVGVEAMNVQLRDIRTKTASLKDQAKAFVVETEADGAAASEREQRAMTHIETVVEGELRSLLTLASDSQRSGGPEHPLKSLAAYLDRKVPAIKA